MHPVSFSDCQLILFFVLGPVESLALVWVIMTLRAAIIRRSDHR